jgi:hypothetical protein
MMDDSNHSRTLRYAQRTRDRLVGDLRREGLTLCTSATVDYETAQRLHALALRVERIAAVLQVLEECTPEPEPAAESEPIPPEPQGPRYAVEVTATAGLDVDEWRAGMADYAQLQCRPDEDASPAYWAGYRDAHAIAEKAPEEGCLRGIIAYATGQQIQPAAAFADSFRAAHAALQHRLAGGDE